MSSESTRPLTDTAGYGQLCPVGFGLDAIGDRWTMLVLRDLARSPLRFKDLQAINPGMSPNLLTQRLRKLEDAGIVDRQAAPHGARGHLYALSGAARDAVLPVLTATADLGAFLIDQIPPEELLTMDLPQVLADQMTLNGHFIDARDSDLRGEFVLDMAGIETHISLTSTGFHASNGAPVAPPTATLHLFPPTVLMRIMGKAMTVDAAEQSGLLTITGDRAAAIELLRLLSFDDTTPEAG